MTRLYPLDIVYACFHHVQVVGVDNSSLLPGSDYVQQTISRPLSSKKLPFHSSLQYHLHASIVEPSSPRCIIYSANVAETTITVPSIDFVVDSGCVALPMSIHELTVNDLPVAVIPYRMDWTRSSVSVPLGFILLTPRHKQGGDDFETIIKYS